jgi:murein DD-endopeptidase MepM/ murein hydrolase activator NlpD
VRTWIAALAVTAILAQPVAAQTSRTRVRSTRTRTAATQDAVKNVFWQPNDLVQGSPAFFTVELVRPARRVTGTWIGKEMRFFHTRNPRIWYTLGGADLETQPGSYELAISTTLTNGRVARSTKKIEVSAGTFGTGDVNVPENYVEPNAEEQRQIASDQKLKDRAFAHDTPEPEWSGNFVPPVGAKATPSFGESRLLNEERTSTHRGTDYPVPEGTPIVAANSGTVVLATSLYYEGNCVILDHGQRLFTIYMHLKQIDVHEGDTLEKGKRLGLSGATGRVTGPHVHLGVRWNGANLDPVKLLAMTLPAVHETSPVGRARRTAHRAARRR